MIHPHVNDIQPTVSSTAPYSANHNDRALGLYYCGKRQMLGTVMVLPPTPSTSDTISLMVERIVAQFHPAQVILFGSQARGEAGPNSDIDLLIVVEQLNGQRKIDLITCIRNSLDDLMVAKDIVVSTCQEMAEHRDTIGHLIHSALKEGQIVYDSQQDRPGN